MKKPFKIKYNIVINAIINIILTWYDQGELNFHYVNFYGSENKNCSENRSRRKDGADAIGLFSEHLCGSVSRFPFVQSFIITKNSRLEFFMRHFTIPQKML